MDIRAIPAKKKIKGGRSSKRKPAEPGYVIQAFEERCPMTKNNGKLKSQGLNAHELFNLFTADIIKTHIIFKR